MDTIDEKLEAAFHLRQGTLAFIDDGFIVQHHLKEATTFEMSVNATDVHAALQRREINSDSKAKEITTYQASNTPDESSPKRGLSAYNLFFQLERDRLVSGGPVRPYDRADVQRIAIQSHQKAQIKRKHRKSHGKISFVDLARTVATAWKTLKSSEKIVFEEHAAIENTRYRYELNKWMSCQKHGRKEAGVSKSSLARYSLPAGTLTSQSFQVAQNVSSNLPNTFLKQSSTSGGPTEIVDQCYERTLSSSLEAVLKQGDILLRNPGHVSPEALIAQIHSIENEYFRQATLLQCNGDSLVLSFHESKASETMDNDRDLFEPNNIFARNNAQTSASQKIDSTSNFPVSRERPPTIKYKSDWNDDEDLMRILNETEEKLI